MFHLIGAQKQRSETRFNTHLLIQTAANLFFLQTQIFRIDMYIFVFKMHFGSVANVDDIILKDLWRITFAQKN